MAQALEQDTVQVLPTMQVVYRGLTHRVGDRRQQLIGHQARHCPGATSSVRLRGAPCHLRRRAAKGVVLRRSLRRRQHDAVAESIRNTKPLAAKHSDNVTGLVLKARLDRMSDSCGMR